MSRKPFVLLCAAAAVVGAALMVYAQTRAFAWDEGFHLLTAQLILRGERPYLDFFFPQTPLNAYWNALWMAVFGDTWRTAHAAAALCTTAACLLTGDYVLRRFPAPEWRLPGAIAALFAMGLNTAVFAYGTIGQAYGFCLLTMVLGFRFCVRAVDTAGSKLAAAAGVLASAAAAASLLTAPAVPVMLIWMLICNRAGSRVKKGLAFCAGSAVPFLPVLWLGVEKPREVLFAVLQYNARYREVGWDGTATEHNLEVFTAWLQSPQAMFLLLLAAGGFFFALKLSGWERGRRNEYYLCGALAAAMGAYLCTAHPTFQRYFLLTVPFLAILAAAGLYWLGSRLGGRTWAVSIAVFLLAACLARSTYDNREAFLWTDVEAAARRVNAVTPPGASIWADEHIYFVSRRLPPSGMEHENSHKPLNLRPEFLRALHILPRPEMEARIRAGAYYTSVKCDEADPLKLASIYAHKEEIGECTVYWQPKVQ